MSNKTQLQENNAKLASLITELQGKAAGGGSGGGAETCTVTVTQTWGMNDDPEFLRVFLTYYNILADGTIDTVHELLTSINNYEPQHSVTFTAYKNVPISVIAPRAYNDIRYTISVNGGTVEKEEFLNDDSSLTMTAIFYALIPTEDTATFTFSSP